MAHSHSPVPNVQDLINELPNDYVVPEDYVYINEHQGSTYPTVDPPTFNLETLLEDLSSNNPEVQNLHSICRRLGYFQIINHGFEESFFKSLNEQVKAFYNISPEEKKKYERKPNEFEGYGNLEKPGGKLDWCDRFFAAVNPISRVKPNLFPQLPSPLRDSLNFFREKLEIIIMQLLKIFSTCLEIDFEEMESIFTDGYQALRIGFYPLCPQPDKVLGITPHSDTTCLTVLHQVNSVDGLQVKEDGVWKLLHVHPEAILIFVGDILEIFSNGEYKSVEHRVIINSEVERFTVVLAFNPRLDAEIKPMVINNPTSFEPITMAEYIDGFDSKKFYGKSYLEKMKARKR